MSELTFRILWHPNFVFHFSSKLFLLMTCRKSRLMLTVCWPFGHFKSNYHHHSILFIIHSLYTIQHSLSEFVERGGSSMNEPSIVSQLRIFFHCNVKSVSSGLTHWSYSSQNFQKHWTRKRVYIIYHKI